MLKQLKIAALSLLGFTLVTGFFYPLVVTAVGQVLWPRQANGSLILNKEGKVIGSSLIGQPFDDPKYFWSRPSATSPAYNAGASSGSNLGPLNPALSKAVEDRILALKKADPGNDQPVPVDLVTASGSGLDPHISPAAAYYQASRIAKARNRPVSDVHALIQAHTQGRFLGLLGEPAVNVLTLNLALDRV